jgi:ribonuclease HI
MSDPVIAYFDGLCEPNPGGIACGGFVILPHAAIGEGRPLAGHRCFRKGKDATNNVAEYLAALLALETLWRMGHRGPVLLRGDSQLVVRQFTGQYGCGAPLLVPLLARLRKAGESFGSLGLEWVFRGENEAADAESRVAYREVTGKEPPVRVKARR